MRFNYSLGCVFWIVGICVIHGDTSCGPSVAIMTHICHVIAYYKCAIRSCRSWVPSGEDQGGIIERAVDWIIPLACGVFLSAVNFGENLLLLSLLHFEHFASFCQ